MRTRVLLLFCLVGVVLLVGTMAVTAQGPQPQAPQVALGTGFTYQGQLKKDGLPFNGTCAMQFGLWDAESSGTQVGAPNYWYPVTVTNGLFTVLLNNGGGYGASAFNGQVRWLEDSVKCGSDSTFTTLSRQPLSGSFSKSV